jgi:sentrin-specific protease 1
MGMLQERSDKEAAAASGGAKKRRVWFANSFFLTNLRVNGYCYQNVRRWTRRNCWTRRSGKDTPTKVLDMDLLIIPRHIGVHWTCVVVDVPARTVTHYDSGGSTAHDDLANVVRWLCDEAHDKCGITMNAGDWETREMVERAPQQHNGW